MPRSRSKNKTLAVGEGVHQEVSRIQKELGLRNHDEVISELVRVWRDLVNITELTVPYVNVSSDTRPLFVVPSSQNEATSDHTYT
jgi:septum formation inhibitor-activating ATPase MinD